MWMICKKEWQQFFNSLTGYIALIIFLLLTGLYLFVFPQSNIFDYGYTSLSSFFNLAPWVLLYLVPTVTMRSIADEYKAGTFELLRTLPLSSAQIAWGKFFGAWLIVIAALLPTIIYPISLHALSSNAGIDLGSTVGSYIGLILLGGVYTAIGICTSSFTNNTVIAFVASAFMCSLLYNGFQAVSKLPAFEGGPDYYIEMLGINFHYRSISRGVVDSRDIVYFIAFIVLFLLITTRRIIATRTNAKENRLWWPGLALGFALVIYLSSFVHYRADLTAEKRFSLSGSTKQMLENLDSAVLVQVFLTGDLSSDYRKLSIATDELLDEFKDYAGSNLRIRFERPGEDLADDTAKMVMFDSLARLGVVFEQKEATTGKDEDIADQFVIPSALVTYGNRKPFAIDLRSSKTVFRPYDVMTQNPEEDVEATRNAAEALLEFKFANAIDKLTREKVPAIAYLVGNGQPVDFSINDLGESLRNDYRLAVLDINAMYPDPSAIDALIIVKPSVPFTDEQKLKLDQYVMHGGKIIWFVDKLYAEYDSLRRTEQQQFVAFDRNLNLDDILFKYGVRINGDLLQDLNCSKLPVVLGQNPDGSPRMQRVPFPYYPFLSGTTDNPISKNLDRVLPLFPSTIDTIRSPAIKKTILLSSDTTSRTLSSPALVALESVRTEADFNSFNKSYLPVAVLLEGTFSSLYSNRVLQQVKDSVQQELGKPFANTSPFTKQIVVSDADIVTNHVSSTNGPMPMGMIPFENYRFANREFFLNCVDYLVSNSAIFESRNKEFTLRLLDKAKVESDRTKWQFINIGLPVVVVLFAGLLLQWLRKRKYAA